MTINRIFLNWNTPFLHSAAEYLLAQHLKDGVLNLSSTTVVVPGARAGRRLMEILLESGEKQDFFLCPPQILTPGSLPEYIFKNEAFFLSDLQRTLCWMKALTDLSEEDLHELLPFPASLTTFSSRFALAETIDSLYTDLSSVEINFSEALDKLDTLSLFNEERRWEVLINLEESFFEVLKKNNCTEKYSQRKLKISENSTFKTTSDIYLLSTVDLNLYTKKLLKKTDSVTALIFAPDEKKNLFDEVGCILTEEWLGEKVDIPEDSLIFCNKQSEEAQAITDFLRKTASDHTVDDVVIGACSPKDIPALQAELKKQNIKTEVPQGTLTISTLPAVFLRQYSAFLKSSNWDSFTTLLRNPVIQNFLHEALEENICFEKLLDNFNARHLQSLIDERLPDCSNSAKSLKKIYLSLKETVPESGKISLPELIPTALEILKIFFPESRQNEYDYHTLEALRHITSVIKQISEVSASISPKVELSEAVNLILRTLRAQNIPVETDEAALNIQGWLEMQLNDSELVMLTSFNEGYVPQAVNSDAFLPDTARNVLGLTDNNKRYVRDLFTLQTILHSSEKSVFIASRYDNEGNPLMPSRLLFACAAEKAAQRILDFNKAQKHYQNPEDLTPLSGKNPFPAPPEPADIPDITAMSVTSFRTWIECPYLFYLRHILKLREETDRKRELDPLYFGIMLHDLLAKFGSGKLKDSTDPKEISNWLLRDLDFYFKKYFKDNAFPALYIQKEFIKKRLINFAYWQAERRKQGWEIREVEKAYKAADNQMKIKSGSMGVEGRIDRIDYNPTLREWAVIDYKTGDRARKPAETHLRSKKWKDLQLPLYSFLVRNSGVKEDINLAYIYLSAEGTQFLPADWTADTIKEALTVAAETAEAVKTGTFWPPSEKIHYANPYAVIYGQGQFSDYGGDDD